MTKRIKSSFIDTDIIQKIGGYRNEKLLSKILTSFGYDLYIHEYLIQEELIFGELSIEQLRAMISANEITILRITDLTESELREYNATVQLLGTEMKVDLNKKRDRNAGEVKSMAMAFVKDFEYFISDDRGARVAAKKHLQNIDGTYLKTIRMRDIILHIRENETFLGINRKTAKRLYLYGVNPKLGKTQFEIKKLETIIGILKKEFDEELWPVD